MQLYVTAGAVNEAFRFEDGDERRVKCPNLREVEPGHFVACHNYDEI